MESKENSFITYLKSKYKTDIIYRKNDLRPWLGTYKDGICLGATMLSHLDRTDYSVGEPVGGWNTKAELTPYQERMKFKLKIIEHE